MLDILFYGVVGVNVLEHCFTNRKSVLQINNTHISNTYIACSFFSESKIVSINIDR